MFFFQEIDNGLAKMVNSLFVSVLWFFRHFCNCPLMNSSLFINGQMGRIAEKGNKKILQGGTLQDENRKIFRERYCCGAAKAHLMAASNSLTPFSFSSGKVLLSRKSITRRAGARKS